MAQAVKCKVCGVAHWGSAHVWPDKATEPKPAKVVPLPKPSKAQTLEEYLAMERARKAAYMRGYRSRQKAK